MAKDKTIKVILKRDIRYNTGHEDKDGNPVIEVHKAGSVQEYPRVFALTQIAVQKAVEFSSDAEKEVKDQLKEKAENDKKLNALATGKGKEK